MNWSTIALSIPEHPGQSREDLFLTHVRQGDVVHNWAPLSCTDGGRTIELEVSEDALALGTPGDAVRIAVTATTAQLIADHLGALLLTPRVSDLIRHHAKVIIAPATQTPDSAMGNTSRMVAHSLAVAQRIVATGKAGLVANAGKDWVLSNRLLTQPDRAANYGWYVAHSSHPGTLAGLFVLQPLGLAHNRFHVDYSQTVRLMRNVCRVDGVDRDLAAVLSDPTLAPLLCHEGVLRVQRQPGVPANGAPDQPPPRKDPIETVPRTLRRGMTGADVASWQRLAGILPADGIFGAGTEAATKAWQAAHGLVSDGIVGPQTRAAAGGLPVFVQAKNYGKGRTSKINTIVIHTMAAEKPDTAERVAQWFAGPSAPMASAHYCVDSHSVVQCVLESDTAFHAPGANQNGIGVEHAGYAKQTAEDWADPHSQTMLRRSAELVAGVCKRYGIPVRFIGVDELKAGKAGITTHHAVSLAFKKSTHTDPGVSFPMDKYLAMVEEYVT